MHAHTHDGGLSAAARDHGHTHEAMEHPGKFALRDVPTFEGRNWTERAFTVGIGGPVGSGKTALTLALCRHFRDRLNLGVVTNDIFTREDQEFLIRNEALADKGRIRAIETGAVDPCPCHYLQMLTAACLACAPQAVARTQLSVKTSPQI